MNENVRKIFDLLGIEPNEKFRIKGSDIFDELYYFDESLCIYGVIDGLTYINALFKILNGTYTIIKLPKKKKLRDLTPEEYDKWERKNCNSSVCDKCDKCIFHDVICFTVNNCWIYHKDLYSDKFLDQEIEVEE